MLLTPDRYDSASVTELLKEVGSGRIGFDHAVIRSILARGSAAAPELVSFYFEEADSTSLDTTFQIFDLLRALRVTEAVPVYVDLAREEADSSEIYEAIAELGSAAIDPLFDLHKEADESAQSDIEFLLAGLRVRDPRIESLLLKTLESAPIDAAIHLALYGDPALSSHVEDRIARLDPSDPDYESQKHELESTLRELKADVTPEAPEPFDIYSEYPEQAPPVFEALDPDEMAEFLQHPLPEVRRQAVESLADEELSDEELDKLLEIAENDTDPTVRSQAWQALAAGADIDEYKDKLLAKFRDEAAHPLERAGAAVALAEGEITEELQQALEAFYQNEETRTLAMRAMWHSFDKRFASFFPPHLEDLHPEWQRQAIWGVGYLGLGHEAGRLEKLFENENVRDHALFSYCLSCPAEITRGRIRGLYRRIEQLAGGLSEEEKDLVQTALDQRLAMNGLEPVFAEAHTHTHPDGEVCNDPSHHH